MKGLCTAPGCTHNERAKGLCATCYTRQRRHGTTDKRVRVVTEKEGEDRVVLALDKKVVRMIRRQPDYVDPENRFRSGVAEWIGRHLARHFGVAE